MAQPWKLPSSRRIDIDNIPATFSSLSQLSGMSRDATMAMLYGDSLSEAMMGEEEALYGGAMPPGMEIDRENALEKTKFQMENPNAIMTPWGPSLAPEEMDIMLQENDGLEALLDVPESQHASLMAEADMIMDQMSDELDDVMDVADDIGMRENMSPFEAAKNIAGDALLGAIDFLFPPDTAYGAETGMPDQTDQILDGAPAGQRPSVEEAMLSGDALMGDIGASMVDGPLSFADAMALGVTGDPNFGRGDPSILQPEVVQAGAGDITPTRRPSESVIQVDPEVSMSLDALMEETADNPESFLEEMMILTQPSSDPDNPGSMIDPAITPNELRSWLDSKDIRYGHPLMPVVPQLYRSTRAQGGGEGVGVGPQPSWQDTFREGRSATDLTGNQNLLKPFYETMNKLEDAGRPDVRAAMGQIFNDTTALFWFWEGDKAFKVKDNPKQLEDQYGAFLEKYVKDPSSFRGGKQFNDRIQWLGGLMEKEQQGLISANPWVKARFSDNAQNTKVLSDLYRTGGSRDYYASGIHSTLGEMRKYWEGMGESNTDVFRRLTAPRTEQVEDASQVIDDTDAILGPPEPVQAGWNGQAI